MKTNKLISFLIVLFLFTSCSEDNLTVVLKESGNLKVRLLEDDNAISDETIYLMVGYPSNGNYSSQQYALDFQKTDKSGVVDFGEINEGNYYLSTKGLERENGVYRPIKIIQVVSGSNKTINMDILDYVGTVDLSVIGYYEESPVSGLKVAILTQEDYYNGGNYEERIKNAFQTKTTNSEGKVSFTLPSGSEYSAIVYGTNRYGNLSYEGVSIGFISYEEEYSRNVYFN